MTLPLAFRLMCSSRLILRDLPLREAFMRSEVMRKLSLTESGFFFRSVDSTADVMS